MKEGESTYLESSPSKSEYFSWINNTNEGATEAQTLINLNFFKWLYDEFGMALDIYAFDAGAIDGPRYYGSMDSEKFKRQFPNDFDPVVELAKSFGCRLGLWGGPDGFGNTDDEEQKRTEMMVSLCRDYDFHLFKFDGVCGQLRLLKQGALARELAECRNFSPDLIVLNHRLRLGEAGPYATTWLWEGKESYIDVFMANQATAPHHRQEELSRGVPPKLQRLTEDHGVCLSSCLGFWEDALVLQAFNRDLICAPQIYGNPWFLKDEEFPKLARIFNLHRRFRDILVKGMLLHGKRFGPHAVSRGLGHTRLVTLRNLTWEPAKYMVRLDSSIGLDKVSKAKIHVRRFHPSEKIMGDYEYGSTIEVEVLPFRSCLLLATSGGTGEIGIDGCDYEVEKDLAGKPVVIKILGLPGRTANVSLVSLRQFNKATIDGKRVDPFASGTQAVVEFPGTPLKRPWHRRLEEMLPCPVPGDAEAIYEATCFAADNNCLETRCLTRAGPSQIPQVQQARDAFFQQNYFINRGVWDGYAFDGDIETSFQANMDRRINGGALRVDFGEVITLDQIVIKGRGGVIDNVLYGYKPVKVEISTDFVHWTKLDAHLEINLIIDVQGKQARCFRMDGTPESVIEFEGYREGKLVDRTKWRASNLFSLYEKFPAARAWSSKFVLDELAPNSYIAVALNGHHGHEGAYVGFKINDRYVGAPDRAPSYPCKPWECGLRKIDKNYTYFLPVTEDMIGCEIEVVALAMGNQKLKKMKPEAWITCYPNPFLQKELVLEMKNEKKAP